MPRVDRPQDIKEAISGACIRSTATVAPSITTLWASSKSAFAFQLENKPLAAPDINVARSYETPSVNHGVAVITANKGIRLASVTAIFPDLTRDVFDHATTLTS
jgi:hypothetical protein